MIFLTIILKYISMKDLQEMKDKELLRLADEIEKKIDRCDNEEEGIYLINNLLTLEKEAGRREEAFLERMEKKELARL